MTNARQISIITKLIVWGSIFSIFFAGIAIAGYAKFTAGEWGAETPKL